MPSALTESIVENTGLTWFGELGYTVKQGLDLAPDRPHPERSSFADVVVIRRLRDTIAQLNPRVPFEAREEALGKVLRPETSSLVGNNRLLHRMLRDGVPVEYRRDDGSIA